MKNFCGQEITIGSVVGLGIRAGDGSEQRVGIVLDLHESQSRWGGGTEWKALCAWWIPEYTWDSELKRSVISGSKVMKSIQKFRFFLLEEASIDEAILASLTKAFVDYMLDRNPSDFVGAR